MNLLALTMTFLTLFWIKGNPTLIRIAVGLGAAIIDLIVVGGGLDSFDRWEWLLKK